MMAKKSLKKVSLISKFFSKFLACVVLLLGILIALKASPSLREGLYKYVFQDHFSFAEVNAVYEKLFGSSLPLTGTEKTAMVSTSKIEYESIKDYFCAGVFIGALVLLLVFNLSAVWVVIAAGAAGYWLRGAAAK